LDQILARFAILQALVQLLADGQEQPGDFPVTAAAGGKAGLAGLRGLGFIGWTGVFSPIYNDIFIIHGAIMS
jgi:hypothetical protein